MATANSTATPRNQALSAGKAALQFTGVERFRVLWLRDGKECRSPWLASRERATKLRDAMASKYGRAIVFAD